MNFKWNQLLVLLSTKGTINIQPFLMKAMEYSSKP